MPIQIAPSEQAGLLMPYFIDRNSAIAWTATVAQSVSVSISSQQSYYIPLGPLVWVHSLITVSGAGVAGNAISIGGQTVGIQAASNQIIIGQGRINDTSVTDYQGFVYVNAATAWLVRYGTGSSFVGATPNFALASGDTIEINCIFLRTV